MLYSHKPFFSRLYGEVKRHHRYLTLFTAPEGESGDKQRILTGVQLLTIQTMLMFLLAMLYDVQSPSDDGSCGTHYDVDNCLDRKSVFDSTIYYCDWTLTDEQDQTYTCLYRNPTFSFKVILYISVIVALLTALISYPTDLIFDTLSAPVADITKAAAQESVINKIGRRASNVARRASNAAMTAASVAKAKITRNKYVVGTVTRKLPGATEAAHALATASMTVIAENSRRSLQQRQLARMRSYQASSGKHSDVLLSVDDLSSSSSESESSSDSDSGDQSAQNTRRGEATNSKNATTSVAAQSSQQVAADQLKKLSEEIHCQRRLLKSSEVEEFDSQWGLDPTGEFTQGERSVVPCLRGRPGAEDSILNELQFVRKESSKKAEKLNIATDAHTGLEILHLFIIDLLGRDTPAAVIFETKSEEDFQHAKVVTRNTKRLAALALFGINAFFVYYAILTGFRKGVAWQQIFLFACIIQFIVEVLLFETMEVMWINCVIPVLVSDEVRRVGESIIEVVQELCSNTTTESRFFLNAPDYLFVSTNVAKQFPHLMESILVQAYNNHVPGELARKWQTGSIARMHRRNRRRQFTVFGLFLRILQYMGTAPFVIHRMFIRFLQPFVFSGLLLLWEAIVSNVIYIAIAIIVLLVALAYGLYRRYQEKVLLGKSQNVTPVAAAAVMADYHSPKSGAVYEEDRVIDRHIPNLTALTNTNNHSSLGSSVEEKGSDSEDDGFEMVSRRHQRHHSNNHNHHQISSEEENEPSSTESSLSHGRRKNSRDPTPRESNNRYSVSNSDLSSLDLSTPMHPSGPQVPHTVGGSPRTISRTVGYGSKVAPRQRVTVARGAYSTSSSEDEHEGSVSDESLASSEGEESGL